MTDQLTNWLPDWLTNWNSMEQINSLEANSCSATHEIPHIMQNTTINCHIQ
jgi:hypothetical protein